MIQTALLPETRMIGSITCSGLFLPSSVVAGDTYNVLTRTDGKLAFFQLDVSGHGAAAALVSVAAHNALSQAALAHVSGEALDEVVDEINRSWPGNLPYFTLIFGELGNRNLFSRAICRPTQFANFNRRKIHCARQA